MRRLLHSLFLFIGLCLAFGSATSCAGESDCTDATRPMLNASVYAIIDDSAVHVALDSLTVTAFGTDSVILNRGAGISTFSLPLRYAEGSTVFVFSYNDSIKDTVTVLHDNTPYFLNMDCGYQMKQVITQVSCTTNGLDSIVIKNAKTDIYGTENLQLYY